MSQVLLVADRSQAVVQPGQPSAQMGAWLLEVPAGSTPLDTASQFAGTAGFPIGTVARVVDITAAGAAFTEWQLDASWAQLA